jgi:hypothetical protein
MASPWSFDLALYGPDAAATAEALRMVVVRGTAFLTESTPTLAERLLQVIPCPLNPPDGRSSFACAFLTPVAAASTTATAPAATRKGRRMGSNSRPPRGRARRAACKPSAATMRPGSAMSMA